MKVLAIGITAFAVLHYIRKGKTARAIKKAADRTTWSAASDTRYPRLPRSHSLTGKRKGLK